MYTANELIELIGKSETNGNVIKLLSELGQNKPLKRPKRGEVDSYVERPENGIELLFRLAETLPDDMANSFQEGELVLDTIFFTPVDGSDSAIYKSLPYDLHFSSTRAEARTQLGNPEWSGDGINNDRWAWGNFKMLAEFSNDESSINSIAIGMG